MFFRNVGNHLPDCPVTKSEHCSVKLFYGCHERYTSRFGLYLYAVRLGGPLQRTEMNGLFQEGYCNLYGLSVQSHEEGI
jgi:hypothetical protein